MTRDEIKNLIWVELTRVLNLILTGQSQGADGQATEGIANLLPGGVPTIPARPVAFPWGYNAQTPDNTPQLTLQAGNSPLARFIAGHFAADRPAIQSGEVILYNQFGQQIYLKNGKVLLGSQSASQPFLLGTDTNSFFNDLLNAIIQHTHAAPGTPPTNVADFESIQSDTISNDSLLSQVVLGE